MEITEVMSSDEIRKIEELLCNMRCDLEELADTMLEKDCEIDGQPEWVFRDIADEIAKFEDYLFEYLQSK